MFARRGFTLIELLVVIAIIGILSVVVILTLNPADLLKQSRDSNRLSDMSTLNTALGTFVTDQPSASLGNSNTVYVSVPDSTTTCANLGLPTAPTGWSYHCAPSSTYRNVDGTGWLPINLSAASFGSPLPVLPADPRNTTSSAYFYSYSPSGTSYESTAVVESSKYISKAANDGGLDGGLYETGTKTAIIPFTNGLVGYWSFDGGDATLVADQSGYGNTLTWHGTSTLNHYSAGHNGTYSAYFAGGSDYLSPTLTSGAAGGKFGTGDFTITYWAKGNGGTAAYMAYVNTHMCGCSEASWTAGQNAAANVAIQDVGEGQHSSPGGNMGDGNWHFVAVGRSGTYLFTYFDGSSLGTTLDGSTPWNLTGGSGINIGTASGSGPYAKDVSIDEVRVYSRALSATEISQIYNATK